MKSSRVTQQPRELEKEPVTSTDLEVLVTARCRDTHVYTNQSSRRQKGTEKVLKRCPKNSHVRLQASRPVSSSGTTTAIHRVGNTGKAVPTPGTVGLVSEKGQGAVWSGSEETHGQDSGGL